MVARAAILYYVTDGTFSVDEARGTLARQGELVVPHGGDARFVPDDPTFPTTVFRRDGIIEFHVDRRAETRLDEYVRRLSRWLKVAVQRKQE